MHKCSLWPTYRHGKTRQVKWNGRTLELEMGDKNWEEYMYFMIIWLTDTSFHAILKTFLHPICLIFSSFKKKEVRNSAVIGVMWVQAVVWRDAMVWKRKKRAKRDMILCTQTHTHCKETNVKFNNHRKTFHFLCCIQMYSDHFSLSKCVADVHVCACICVCLYLFRLALFVCVCTYLIRDLQT